MQEFAPPAAPLLVSASEAASGYVLIRLPAGWVGEAHPSPHRQILFCLKGSMDVFTSTGEKRRISAGDIWVMADTSRKGPPDGRGRWTGRRGDRPAGEGD